MARGPRFRTLGVDSGPGRGFRRGSGGGPRSLLKPYVYSRPHVSYGGLRAGAVAGGSAVRTAAAERRSLAPPQPGAESQARRFLFGRGVG